MAVLRWKFVDPFEKGSDPAEKSYTFPRNPREMSGVYPDLAITTQRTTAGKVVAWEGQTPVKQFTFSGVILDRDHFQDMYHWIYAKRRRLFLYDHFARRFTVVMTSLDLIPKRRIGRYYSHDYTASGQILNWTVSNVPDIGHVLPLPGDLPGTVAPGQEAP